MTSLFSFFLNQVLLSYLWKAVERETGGCSNPENQIVLSYLGDKMDAAYLYSCWYIGLNEFESNAFLTKVVASFECYFSAVFIYSPQTLFRWHHILFVSNSETVCVGSISAWAIPQMQSNTQFKPNR